LFLSLFLWEIFISLSFLWDLVFLQYQILTLLIIVSGVNANNLFYQQPFKSAYK